MPPLATDSSGAAEDHPTSGVPTGTQTPPRVDPDGQTQTKHPSGEPIEPPPWDGPPRPRFQHLREHRERGMGKVSVALDVELHREVAFKEIRDHLADVQAHRERFLFEAEVTGRLEHPGIVPVYGLGRHPTGRPFYAMRFIAGQTLRDAIRGFHAFGGLGRPSAPLTITEQAVAFRGLLSRFLSVCQTIAYAHSQGVIHRDLKPENIMLGPFGETLVIDWGLARRLRAGPGEANVAPEPVFEPVDEAAVTMTKGGTPLYWAPEQIPGHPAEQDERTDIYGLGGILFEILTGQPPYPDGSRDRPPTSPKAVRRPFTSKSEDLPARPLADDVLEAIVLKALALNSGERFASTIAMADAVERWLADQPAAAQRAAVMALRSQWREGNSKDHAMAEHVARQCVNLGHILSGMGRDDDAIHWFIDAAQMFADLSTDYASQPRFQAEEANCYIALAQSAEKLGKATEAAEYEKKAAAMYRGLIAAHPDEYKTNIATIMRTRAAPAQPPPRESVAAPPNAPADALTAVQDPSDPSPPKLENTAVALPRVISPAERVGAPPTPYAGSRLPAAHDHTAHPFATRPAEPDQPDWTETNLPLTSVGRQVGEPEFIQGYTPVQQLGRGGIGRVILARDNALGRLVAIKELNDRASRQEKTRFLREMQVMANLRHANIVVVYTYGVHGSTGHPFIVMEYIAGKNLSVAATAFHARGGMPRRTNADFTRLLHILAQVCDAIHYANEQGVIHRDPKPANILIRSDGSAVVLDWGIAKVMGNLLPGGSEGRSNDSAELLEVQGVVPGATDLTHTGAVMGTPRFMSPEQATDAARVDRRSDIYVLGGSLFFILTGQYAIEVDDLRDALTSVLTGQIRRPREVNPAIPPDLDAICSKAMALRPEDRYPTAAALADDIRAWLAGGRVSASPRGRITRVWDRLVNR